MTDAIKELWALIGAGITGLIWGIRLEGKANGNSAEIRRLWMQRAEDRQALKDALDRLDKRMDEVGGDVKSLLREVRK